MTNKELQELLKQYPDDMKIGSIVNDPDYPEEWEVDDGAGVMEMHFGYKGRNKSLEKCLVIN